MEGGNLKLSIALGQKPTIIQKGPFYLMKQVPNFTLQASIWADKVFGQYF
jgi:hypothetical protein